MDAVYENAKAIEVKTRFEYADNGMFCVLAFDLAGAIGQFEGKGHTVVCSGADMDISEDGVLQLIMKLGDKSRAS